MPSTRTSSFAGGGGILRRKDGTIIDILFTTENPLFKDKNEPKEGAFTWLYAILTIQEDGRDQLTKQPLKVGDVNDFEVVCDGRGVKGSVAFGKNSQWGIFASSLENPKDGGKGQPVETYPEDPEGLVADYSNIRGTRVMFDWVEDLSKWAKANPRKRKDKDGKPVLGKDGKQILDPRENLVVAQYYGQVPVEQVAQAAKAASKPSSGGRPAGSKPAARTTAPAAPAPAAADIAARAEEEVIKAVMGMKGKPLSKTKLSVKLLTQLGDADQNLSNEVRLWANDDNNLKSVEGVSYDPAKQELTLTPAA